jgi:hypothetical protein
MIMAETTVYSGRGASAEAELLVASDLADLGEIEVELLCIEHR